MKLKTLLSRSSVESPITKTYECIITAETAKELLDNFNDSNRPLSNSLAKLYANEFLRNAWAFNGESIIFAVDEEGNEKLASGQHRLKALIIANNIVAKEEDSWSDAQLEMRVVITTGVPIADVDTIDVGKTRNHADILFRNPLVDNSIPEDWNTSDARRKKWCKTLATAARLVWQRQGGKTVSSAEKFNTTEMLTFIGEQHPNLPKYVTLVLNADDGDGGVGGLKKISFAYTAGLTYLACLDAEGEEDVEACDKVEMFLDQVAQNNGLKPGDAAHSITGFWNSLPPGSKDRDTEVCGPFVKCLNALIAGERTTPSKMKLTKKELENYRKFPILLAGWDTYCFEYATDVAAEEEVVTEEVVEEVVEEVIEEEPKKPVKKAPKKKRVLNPEDIPEIDEDDYTEELPSNYIDDLDDD
jgi:hypothetical protein